MSKEAIILKSDAGGRVLVPVDRQVELVREFERSGLSGPRFAEIARVKYQTFTAWRRKHGSPAPTRRPRMSSPPIPSASWLEAAMEPAGETSNENPQPSFPLCYHRLIMRRARFFVEGAAFYHCMSRVVDKQFILREEEKRYFLRWLLRLERFSGIEIITD